MLSSYLRSGLFLTLLAFPLAPLAAQTNDPPPGVPPAPPKHVEPDWNTLPPQGWEKDFSEFQFKTFEENGHVLPYRFYQPSNLEPGKSYPLVLLIHGLGERGTDNRHQLS